MEPENEKLFTVNEVVNILRVKHNKVYELIRNKELKAFRIGNHGRKSKYNRYHWRIREEDLVEFINHGANVK